MREGVCIICTPVLYGMDLAVFAHEHCLYQFYLKVDLTNAG